MKIEIESLDDLRDLIGVMNPEFLRRAQPALGPPARAADIARDLRSGTATPQTRMEYRERDIEGTHRQLAEGKISEAFAAEQLAACASEPEAEAADPTLDADGVAHNPDWHSDPPKINADGRWRARRKRDEDAYKAWLLEQSVEGAEAAVAADAEPVATETHALPQDEDSRAAGADYAGEGGKPHPGFGHTEPGDSYESETAGDPAPTVDLSALVEACQEAALDASDSHMDLIKACQAFISDHGHSAYNALKAAVAPLEGAENGKAVPQFTPAERRLMRACIDKYPLN